MNSSIYKSLKSDFISNADINNKSTIELCITEMSSGNFNKAVDLSEEIIKKDINDSIGWASKALSQANLFDYGNNLFFLKSSLTSLEEFRNKTTLSNKEIIKVESIFYTAFLDRTINLVNSRVEEVIELRKKALTEKKKAQAAAIGAALSAYAGSQSKSDVGKILGYGGAVAGVAAAANFSSNADLLNNASKGVFGVAVANISMSIGSAISLKSNLSELDFEIRDTATSTLKNWINVLAFLYQQVIENLLVYAEDLKKKNVFSKSFREASINLINAPEATQFIYLTKITGIDKSIAEFSTLENHMLSLKEVDEEAIKSDTKKMSIIFGSVITLGFVIIGSAEYDENTKNIGVLVFWIGVILAGYFSAKPIGKAGELKKSISEFYNTMKNFKINTDSLIVENMIAQKKVIE